MKKILLSLILLFILTGHSWAVVSSTISQNEYACNSSNTAWNYTFPIILSTDIQVWTIDSMGNATPQTSNFSVNTYTQTVTYPVTGTPCATGYSILLERVEPFTQLVAASNQGPSPSPVVMTMSDKLTMLAQQLSNNSVQSSPGTVGTVVLPAYTAGDLIAWSSTLNKLANVANPSAVAQWSLSGANISYNVGNVSTTNNMTAANFNGNLNGGINWSYIPGTLPSSGVNWNDIGKYGTLNSGGVNWNDINRYAEINGGAINWPGISYATTTGINWNGMNIPSTGMNWNDINVQGVAPWTRVTTCIPSGQVSAVSSFSCNVTYGVRYKLLFSMNQNTSAAYYKLTFSGDTGSHYSNAFIAGLVGTGAIGGGNNAAGGTYIPLNMGDSSHTVDALTIMFSSSDFETSSTSTGYVVVNMSGYSISGGNSIGGSGGGLWASTPLTSFTVTVSAGTMTGAVALYQEN